MLFHPYFLATSISFQGPQSPSFKIPALAPYLVTTDEAFAVPNCIAFEISPDLMYSTTNPELNESPAPVLSTTGESGTPAVYIFLPSETATPSGPLVMTKIPSITPSINLNI